MEDNRRQARCNVHWRSAIVIAERGQPQTIQCKTNDISAGGVSIICHRNLSPGHVLTVYLLIEPATDTHPQVIFEAQGTVVNTVLSGQQGGFRLGIQFTKFARDSKQLLQKYLPKEPATASKRLIGATDLTPPPAAPVPPPEVSPPAADPVAAESSVPPAGDAAAAEEAPATDEATAEGEAEAAGEAPKA